MRNSAMEMLILSLQQKLISQQMLLFKVRPVQIRIQMMASLVTIKMAKLKLKNQIDMTFKEL